MTSGKQKLKALQYKTYDELKCKKLDENMLHTLKKMSIKNCLGHYTKIIDEARVKRMDGDEEHEYILCLRALDIYRIIMDKKDDAFGRSNEGRRFKELSDAVITRTGLLVDNLKSRYLQLAEKAIENGKLTQLKASHTTEKETITNFGIYIKAVDLVHLVEGNKSSVLVVDYRKDQNKYVDYKPNQWSIISISLDADNIVPGCLLHSLISTADISVRPYLEKISQYDLVVLLGDTNDIDNVKGTKTYLLYDVLTTYNSRSKLKRQPVILDKGFQSWEYAYPYYIAYKNDIPEFEKTFDEQFTIWIQELKKNNRLDIHYPDLLKKDSKRIEKQASNNKEAFSKKVYDNNGPSGFDAKHQVIEKPKSKEIDQPKNHFTVTNSSVEPKRVPPIDRSNKPSSNFSFAEASNRSEQMEKSNKENQVPEVDGKNMAIPKVQTHGGARTIENDSERIHTQLGRPEIISVQPPRPPTPDRTTKNNVLQRRNRDDLDLFSKSYDMVKAKITEESSSKRCNTRFGWTGLINMGNTCFMNATLQALFHTPKFTNLFRNNNIINHINIKNHLGTQGIISGCFSALIDLVWSGKFSALRPYTFLQIFAQRVNASLANRQQHDAQEFQIYLLDALHEDTNRVCKKLNFEQNYDATNLLASAEDYMKKSRQLSSSPVNDIFNLITVSTLCCKACSATSVCFEGHNQISIELPISANEYGRMLSLRDCLKTHFSTTLLDAPWDCPKCRSKQLASRTTKIWKGPEVLIIHLKRFSFHCGHYVKNEVDINFDVEHFDLIPHMHSKISTCNASYSLYAVTNHVGTLNSGHYTSFVRNMDSKEREWLYFDDERCSRVHNSSSVLSRQAFLLYYVRDGHHLPDGKTPQIF